MVKTLFIGDPHFKIKNVEYIPLFVAKILSIVDKHSDLDFVVVAGDLLDNHDRVDVEPYNLALDFINALRRRLKTFVLVGNHDYKNNQQFLTDHHWMNALKWWDNVFVVDDVYESVLGGADFLFVPYTPPGRFVEAICTKFVKGEFTRFSAVFAHQEFRGCKMGPIESKIGDEWDLDWPLVISGHVHNKQWSQENVYYPGSAMQHAFGQSVDNTVSIIEWVRGDSGQCRIEYDEIDLKMPRLVIKYLSVKDVERKSVKYKQSDSKKYKLVLKGAPEEFQAFKKSLCYKELVEDGVKVVFKMDSKALIDPVVGVEAVIQKKFLDILDEKIRSEHDNELHLVYRSLVRVSDFL
jgi:DNA repair exonuclease SbcCD nuclease subunit